mmetsp:Transcript_34655/g.45583  ORF Transcript_34655/g.45583 Transcript_34655/m.45583 type:complete len:108 (-) Transcript_34655:1329-1652(-)
MFHSYFSQYTDRMFAQLLIHSCMRELTLGEALYKKGEMANHFYFLVRGQLHLTVVESSHTKMSLTIEENSFFGFRECTTERNDFATSKDKSTEVIQIDTRVYKSLIT